jgi:hypothetical protein
MPLVPGFPAVFRAAKAGKPGRPLSEKDQQKTIIITFCAIPV